MHWFWRAAIAVMVGSGFSLVYSYWGTEPSRPYDLMLWLYDRLERVVEDRLWRRYIAATLVWTPPTVLVGIATYGVLTRYVRPRLLDGETRSRKCGYILKGITEPRCPECGERI